MSNDKSLVVKAKNDFVFFKIEREFKCGIIQLKTEEYQEKDRWLKESPAIVMSVGEEVKNIKVGDRILVGAVASARYDYLTKILKDQNPENITYFACHEKDIVAVIE